MSFQKFDPYALFQKLDDSPAKAAKVAKADSSREKVSALSRQAGSAADPEPKSDRLARADGGEQPALPSALVVIADAIAANPRSPVLNDLALSRGAACFIAVERSAQAAPTALRAEIRKIAAEFMTLAACEIRRSNYQAAYDALDILAGKVRELRAP
jgi:hypothetical protein